MSFSTQTIRYGWVALASLGVLTGTTIYVANNQRHQVKPQDIIEIALGTYERCLATQTSTNPTYSVTPPSFVRTWTSNVYTTNGVTVHTNIVTNTIGWHIDRDMMISLDTTIKALIPHYVDTNTVYDGTTNIVMLTVTGLWASLGIGDKTNQFTRTPCWTNPVSTNWVVNYTSYWPSTNGTATNIVYTSDYQQVVNYAQSWTATGGHVWVTASNWASEVVTVTNAATYGDYPWQIYVEDLQERYKVLNALKMTALSSYARTNFNDEYKVFASCLNIPATEGTWTKGEETIGNRDGTVYEINITDYADYMWTMFWGEMGIGKVWVFGDSFGYPCYRIFFHGEPKGIFTFVLNPSGGVRIWNCFNDLSWYGYNNPAEIEYDATSVQIDTTSSDYPYDVGIKMFLTATPTFLYCTNKYW